MFFFLDKHEIAFISPDILVLELCNVIKACPRERKLLTLFVKLISLKNTKVYVTSHLLAVKEYSKLKTNSKFVMKVH